MEITLAYNKECSDALTTFLTKECPATDRPRKRTSVPNQLGGEISILHFKTAQDVYNFGFSWRAYFAKKKLKAF